jgi:AcrR family transcriptional regulator
MPSAPTQPVPARRLRADGARSRAAILRAAADLASVVGLEGLSIGALAAHLGVSKSGVFAHFRSKEELELATIETAEAIFAEEVLRPALAAPPGLARLRALAERFLVHVERRTFPGGCFFAAAAAEFDARTGPVRERVTRFVGDWLDTVRRYVEEAKRLGEIGPRVDAGQLAFEVSALLNYGNAAYVLTSDPRTLAQARAGIEAALVRAARDRRIRRSRSVRRRR